ncbi:DUF1697 domain-containing protein [Agrobacterium sp. ES01]|uniref:DUF1697 domain-containing protein n=1 Tax=Agrobacterium sp. ES01 TaxID=3420714 RepID=UPI003D10AFBE
MPVFVALIGAVNVGGTAKLSMEDLREIAKGLGYNDVSTYIQSGNLIFSSDDQPAFIIGCLSEELERKLGSPTRVFVRRADEMRAIADNNPFAGMPADQVLVSFFSAAPGDTALHGFVAPDGEEAVVRGREIYVHYPLGSGRSKIKLPSLRSGTSRNINTVTKLADMATKLENNA